jgi:hypothetical protein
MIQQEVSILKFDWSILGNLGHSIGCKCSKFEKVEVSQWGRWYPGTWKRGGDKRFGSGRHKRVHVQR